jgi:hypothetical protein
MLQLTTDTMLTVVRKRMNTRQADAKADLQAQLKLAQEQVAGQSEEERQPGGPTVELLQNVLRIGNSPKRRKGKGEEAAGHCEGALCNARVMQQGGTPAAAAAGKSACKACGKLAADQALCKAVLEGTIAQRCGRKFLGSIVRASWERGADGGIDLEHTYAQWTGALKLDEDGGAQAAEPSGPTYAALRQLHKSKGGRAKAVETLLDAMGVEHEWRAQLPNPYHRRKKIA